MKIHAQSFLWTFTLFQFAPAPKIIQHRVLVNGLYHACKKGKIPSFPRTNVFLPNYQNHN